MRIGIYANSEKDKGLKVTRKIVVALKKRGVDCFLHESISIDEIEHRSTPENFDMVIAVGGDGTLLKVTVECARYAVPVLGFNLGNLGFLTECEPSQIEEVCDAVAKKNYTVEKRAMLSASFNNETYLALNDVVLQRESDKMMLLNVTINGNKLDTFYSDGYIVSTPTGSTAYSLSAGGPILSPSACAFALTPINSHSLRARPVVIGDNEKVVLNLCKRGNAHIIIDGKTRGKLSPSQQISVVKASVTAGFIRLKNCDFYGRLLSKLNAWGVGFGGEE